MIKKNARTLLSVQKQQNTKFVLSILLQFYCIHADNDYVIVTLLKSITLGVLIATV